MCSSSQGPFRHDGAPNFGLGRGPRRCGIQIIKSGEGHGLSASFTCHSFRSAGSPTAIFILRFWTSSRPKRVDDAIDHVSTVCRPGAGRRAKASRRKTLRCGRANSVGLLPTIAGSTPCAALLAVGNVDQRLRSAEVHPSFPSPAGEIASSKREFHQLLERDDDGNISAAPLPSAPKGTAHHWSGMMPSTARHSAGRISWSCAMRTEWRAPAISRRQ